MPIKPKPKHPPSQYFIFLICSLLLPNFAHSRTDLYMGLAPALSSRSSQNNLYEIALGDACNVMLGLQQVLPCNPAFMGEVEGKFFQMSYMTDDDQNFVNKGAELIKNNKNYDFSKSLFDKTDMVDTESNLQLSFRYKTFGLEVIPYKESVWILSRDSSNPVIAIQTQSEQSIAGVIGGHVNENNSFGLKIRLIKRQVIQDEFSFLQATLGKEEILQINTQNAISFEPGYAYFNEDSWRTRFSAVIKNWEMTDQRIEGSNTQPLLIFGLGATPYDKSFTWDVGLTHRGNREIKQGLTLTSQTRFKNISYFAMLSSDRYNIGGSFLLRELQTTLSFNERHYSQLDKDLPLQKSIQLEFSYIF
ncbi:MAG: hypothetical protein HOO06_01950 [Bdellovibrionaceae bacterium]|jgi:hypothetical protein|nr:hypothetical protein [Pseudobdellovibrionaceae bacterium]